MNVYREEPDVVEHPSVLVTCLLALVGFVGGALGGAALALAGGAVLGALCGLVMGVLAIPSHGWFVPLCLLYWLGAWGAWLGGVYGSIPLGLFLGVRQAVLIILSRGPRRPPALRRITERPDSYWPAEGFPREATASRHLWRG